ncbi:Crp/Fnr family transcriptional regulator [Winogradskyella sediminis]|uniref:cAMP-binding domain of CRP or a regulatory subunit of cAMP-dependent protein kinases n=1 Tax=Winogradskyella sediminis TaxID=1382466 RepID=A0A1H1V5G4_9FLAO|nr:Crp/Fnr family transcriptional regulator [Winogradskyella sediminis]REG87626.1 CRP-like cAMP-binding protein [Winogradskyella sediminis]SDS79952.1 cAMP-binding domain of CRP or a regulatory subunit of cAMP-dependent protein kinases [Winogradskyella sediminis]
MQSDNLLITVAFNDLIFTQAEIKIIEPLFQKINVTKGTILLHADDLVEFQYYILDGCLRTYHTDTHGKEHTIQFGINDWWVSDYTAFVNSGKAILTIEALQDSTLYKISYEDMNYLYSEIPKIDRYFRIKLERSFAAFQKRIVVNLSQSAKERYLTFISTHPEIVKNLKNYHIASYLGITTESLSRIKKELHNF